MHPSASRAWDGQAAWWLGAVVALVMPMLARGVEPDLEPARWIATLLERWLEWAAAAVVGPGSEPLDLLHTS